MVSVRSLLGLGRIPVHRTSASRWLATRGVSLIRALCDGGLADHVEVTDLPEPERRAWAERSARAAGLEPGAFDDAAHEAFLRAPPSMRAAAERKAAIARLLLTEGARLSWAERVELVAARVGPPKASKATLRRLLAAVEGVDPINFAPALLAGHGGEAAKASTSENAWRLFLTTLRAAGPGFPLRAAWRDVRDVAGPRGWDWPSYETIARRWRALPEAQRRLIREGRDAAAKGLSQPVLRDKAGIAPLEWVSLDGRMLDFWGTGATGARSDRS